jgi:peptidoglycan/xylan/chitin deacetylase (PgdA/CDA1 family)
MTATRGLGLTACPILMYHALEDEESDLCVRPAAFREQMMWLRDNGFETISLDECAARITGASSRRGRSVVITFDDGYADNLEHGVPVLRELGFTATVFIATGSVGGRAKWLDVPWPMMTWAQIAECDASGITIGAHTVTHPHLGQIPMEQARDEMARSKDEIEQHLGGRVTWMCYPFGDHTPEVESETERLGFRGAVSVRQGNVNRAEDLFRLRRFYIGPKTDLRHFALATSRLWTWKHGALGRLRS